jgi:hypothetical protein
VIWLLRHLKPDFKTIADFRRDNRDAFPAVFRQFVLLCREMDLFGRYWRVGKKFPPASRPMFSHQLAEFAYNGTLNWAGPSTVMSVRSRTALIVTL